MLSTRLGLTKEFLQPFLYVIRWFIMMAAQITPILALTELKGEHTIVIWLVVLAVAPQRVIAEI